MPRGDEGGLAARAEAGLGHHHGEIVAPLPHGQDLLRGKRPRRAGDFADHDPTERDGGRRVAAHHLSAAPRDDEARFARRRSGRRSSRQGGDVAAAREGDWVGRELKGCRVDERHTRGRIAQSPHVDRRVVAAAITPGDGGGRSRLSLRANTGDTRVVRLAHHIMRRHFDVGGVERDARSVQSSCVDSILTGHRARPDREHPLAMARGEGRTRSFRSRHHPRRTERPVH